MVEARRLAADFLAPGNMAVIDADLVADANHNEVRIAATVAGWVAISTDGGNIFTPLGSDVISGVNVGPMSAGQRMPVKFRIQPPTEFRQRRIGIAIGTGV